jgi:cardiolipin synthase
MSGEGVQDLEHMFLRDWTEAAKVNFQQTDRYYPPQEKGAYKHQLSPTEGFYLEKTFTQFIRDAKHSIMIGTPYFIPSKKVLRELEDALNRGVKLEVIVPMVADHPFVKEASYPYLRKLIKLGATFYQYKKGFYHAKVLIIDETVCDIGTANFDKRSFFLNHEINCYTFDKKYIAYVRDLLKGDQEGAHVAQLEDLRSYNPWKIAIEMVARSISFFL